MTGAIGGEVVNSNEPGEADQRAGQADLAQLLKRAEAGDRSVLPQLQRALDGNPDLWRGYGDLAAHAEASLAMLAAGQNLLLAESLKRKLAALKAELGGESPSALERLLIERVAATWLQVNYHDTLVAQAAGAGEARLRALQRQQDAAHRRHLAALKQLAVVRRLLRPAPSPLELLRAPVGETSPGAAKPRRDAGLPRCGSGVEN
jgi:hypothetical protein